MSLFKNIKDKIIPDRPTREETILNTQITLGKLRDRYEKILRMQRRILKSNPTPQEEEMAKSKIRSAMCAYTIVNQASKDLNEVQSELAFNKALSELNGALRTINKLGMRNNGFTKKSLSKQVTKLKAKEEKIQPDDIFTDEAQDTVSEWLGSKWEDVAQRYIDGADLENCLRDSKIILERNPMPNFEFAADLFGDDAGGSPGAKLDGLLNGDLF